MTLKRTEQLRMTRYHTRTRTMGSIEVYNPKQEKWVPYMPVYDKWYQHFKHLRDGYVQPDHMGRYIVDSWKRNKMLKEMEAREKEMEAHEKQKVAREKQIALREQQSPALKQVTPVAQTLKIVKWEMEREQKENKGIEGGQQTRKIYKTPMNWNSFRY